MKKKRALVIGGGGFIGSHLVKSLVADGYDAVVSADIGTPRFEVEGAEYKYADVREPLPDDLCPGATEIYNLAAVHVTPGHQDWEYFFTNVLGAVHCCDYARRVGCDQIVFTSSIAVYGASESPKDETSKLGPDSAYGRSKLCAERIHSQWFHEVPESRRLVVARPAVIYGYTEQGNFTRLARAMQSGRFFFPGRNDTIKACGYVEDLVRSFAFVLSQKEACVTYNFAHKEVYTSQDICDALAEVAGYKKVRFVVPLWLVMLGGLGFELLNSVGMRTSINRARILKLNGSTNILPSKLQELGFEYRYTLRQSLKRWFEMGKEDAFR